MVLFFGDQTSVRSWDLHFTVYLILSVKSVKSEPLCVGQSNGKSMAFDSTSCSLRWQSWSLMKKWQCLAKFVVQKMYAFKPIA